MANLEGCAKILPLYPKNQIKVNLEFIKQITGSNTKQNEFLVWDVEFIFTRLCAHSTGDLYTCGHDYILHYILFLALSVAIGLQSSRRHKESKLF